MPLKREGPDLGFIQKVNEELASQAVDPVITGVECVPSSHLLRISKLIRLMVSARGIQEVIDGEPEHRFDFVLIDDRLKLVRDHPNKRGHQHLKASVKWIQSRDDPNLRRLQAHLLLRLPL